MSIYPLMPPSSSDTLCQVSEMRKKFSIPNAASARLRGVKNKNALIKPALLSTLLGGFVLVCTVEGLAQQIPQTVYIYSLGTPAQNIMLASLAGIVNRNTDGELLLSPNNSTLPNPLFWLNELK